MASGVDDGGGGGGGPVRDGVRAGHVPQARGVGGDRAVPPAAGPGGGDPVPLAHGVGRAGAVPLAHGVEGGGAVPPAAGRGRAGPAPLAHGVGGGAIVGYLAVPPAVHQQGNPPAAHQQDAAADAAVVVPGRGDGILTFEQIISRYINEEKHEHLELYLKNLMQTPVQAPTPDLEHVPIILSCRMAHVMKVAKEQGYDCAYGYFQCQIKPLLDSESPYANHENIISTINWIDTSLKQHQPLVFDTEELKISICDYIRFYMPKEVNYPASLGLRSLFYEFVFPVSRGKYRCLLCQVVWSSKPGTFLHKHFKGKQVCPNQTIYSKQRYDKFTHLTAKRKAESTASTSLKLKEARIEQTEEDAEMDKETEDLGIQQLITRGRACIEKLDEPFGNRDNKAFMQIQNEMQQVFLSMERSLTSQNSQQLAVDFEHTDPQGRAIDSRVYATQKNDLPESSNRGSHLSSDPHIYTGPSLQFETPPNEFCHALSDWTPDELSLLSQNYKEAPDLQNLWNGSDATMSWSPETEKFLDKLLETEAPPELPVYGADAQAIYGAQAVHGQEGQQVQGEGEVVHMVDPKFGLSCPEAPPELPVYGADAQAIYGAQAVHGQEGQQVPGEGEAVHVADPKHFTDFII